MGHEVSTLSRKRNSFTSSSSSAGSSPRNSCVNLTKRTTTTLSVVALLYISAVTAAPSSSSSSAYTSHSHSGLRLTFSDNSPCRSTIRTRPRSSFRSRSRLRARQPLSTTSGTIQPFPFHVYYNTPTFSAEKPLLSGSGPQSCFHYYSPRGGATGGADCGVGDAGSGSSMREHFNDALFNRIISGRRSSSPRWRRRTRRAAATLGIRRQYNEEQYTCQDDDPDIDDICNMSTIADTDDYGYYDQGTIDIRATKQVPPHTSIIRNYNNNSDDNDNDDHDTSRFDPSSTATAIRQKRKRLQIQRFTRPKKKLTLEQQQRAKHEWAAKYTSIDTLRQSFGTNRNRLWGDFDSKITRRLYHTLLPRALLGLYEVGLWSPTDLAPLAFEARLAAKKYARERCILPARLAAQVYDGFRSWRTWGTWSVEGMSWEQIWNKYETQILEEYVQDNGGHMDLEELQEEITAQICLRILERSCVSNQMIDRMFLEGDKDSSSGVLNGGSDLSGKKKRKRRNAERELARIKIKLDEDIEKLLETNLMDSSSSAVVWEFGGVGITMPFSDIWALSLQNFVEGMERDFGANGEEDEDVNGQFGPSEVLFLKMMAGAKTVV